MNMAMSFDFDVSTDVVDGPGTYQGDLASSYSAGLYVVGASVTADYTYWL